MKELTLLKELKGTYSTKELKEIFKSLKTFSLNESLLDKEVLISYKEIINNLESMGCKNKEDVLKLSNKIDYIKKLYGEATFNDLDMLKDKALNLKKELREKGIKNINSLLSLESLFLQLQEICNCSSYNISLRDIYEALVEIRNLVGDNSYPLKSFVNIVVSLDEKEKEYEKVQELKSKIRSILSEFNCRDIEELSKLYKGIQENTWRLVEPELEQEGAINYNIDIQEALSYTFHYGKYNGKTLQEIFIKNQSYLKWLLNNNISFLSNYIRLFRGLENGEITLNDMKQCVKEVQKSRQAKVRVISSNNEEKITDIFDCIDF